ncbi:hypothetical protein ACE6H2_018426 [Prunus campanulata]
MITVLSFLHPLGLLYLQISTFNFHQDKKGLQCKLFGLGLALLCFTQLARRQQPFPSSYIYISSLADIISAIRFGYSTSRFGYFQLCLLKAI